MPLSGPNAGLGSAILDAAQMALFETGGDQLTLVPRDTKGTPAGAAAAAHSAVDSGVKLILGPLLAAEVEAVTPIARDAHINVIAFSTVTNLAGDGIYLMGFLPRQEVVREVTYARQRGIARFATLAPDSPYGHLMADALRETAASSGATVTKTVFFDPQRRRSINRHRRLVAGRAGPRGRIRRGLLPILRRRRFPRRQPFPRRRRCRVSMRCCSPKAASS